MYNSNIDGEEEQVIYGVPEHYIGLLDQTNIVTNDEEEDDYNWKRNHESQEDEEDHMSYLEVDSGYWRKKRKTSASYLGQFATTDDNEQMTMQGVFSMFAKYDSLPHHQLQQYSGTLRSSQPWDTASMSSTLPSQSPSQQAIPIAGPTVVGPVSRHPFSATSTPYAGFMLYDNHGDPGTLTADGIAAIENADDNIDITFSVNPRKNLDFGQSPQKLDNVSNNVSTSSINKLPSAIVRFNGLPSMNPLPRRPLDTSFTPKHTNRHVVMDETKMSPNGDFFDLDRPAHWGTCRKPLLANSARKKSLDTPTPISRDRTQSTSKKRTQLSLFTTEVPLPKSSMKTLQSQAEGSVSSTIKSVSFTPSWVRSKQRLTPSTKINGREEETQIPHVRSTSVEDEIMDDNTDFAPLRLTRPIAQSSTWIQNQGDGGKPSHDPNISPSGKTKLRSSATNRSLLWRLQKIIREEGDGAVVLSECSKDPGNKSVQHLHPKNKAKLVFKVVIIYLTIELDNFAFFKVRVLEKSSRLTQHSSINTAVHDRFQLPNGELENDHMVTHSSMFLQEEDQCPFRNRETVGLLLLSRPSTQSRVPCFDEMQHVVLYDAEELSPTAFKNLSLPISSILAQDDSFDTVILGSTLWETFVA